MDSVAEEAMVALAAHRSARRISTAKKFMAMGVVFLMVGLLWPLVNLLCTYPWLLCIALGIVLCTAAAVAIVQECGLVQFLLPSSCRRAICEMPVIDVMMSIRASVIRARKGQALALEDAPIDGGMLWLASMSRLAAVCMMDLDDELVHAFVADLDPAFRRSASAPIVASVPVAAQQLLLGRTGMAQQAAKARRAETPPSPTSVRAFGAARQWRLQSPSAFAKDLLSRRAAWSAASVDESLEPSLEPHGQAAEARGSKARAAPAVADMPLRIARHRLITRPYRRCKAYVRQTRVVRLLTWVTSTYLGIVQGVVQRILKARSH